MAWTGAIVEYASFIPPAGTYPFAHAPDTFPFAESHVAFSAMRALALSQSKTFAALILLLSLGPVGANVVRAASSFWKFPVPMDACY